MFMLPGDHAAAMHAQLDPLRGNACMEPWQLGMQLPAGPIYATLDMTYSAKHPNPSSSLPWQLPVVSTHELPLL